MKSTPIVFILIICSFKFSFAQVNDTTKQKKNDLKEVFVNSQKLPLTIRVGENKQPLWTTMRMFPSTRVYVMNPPGSAMYERWFDIRQRKNGPAQVRMRDEFTFGLAKRLQLDLYSHTVLDGTNGNHTFGWRGFSYELRFAFAEWGKIWGNPTLYLEHKLFPGNQGIEPKLLLGDKLGKKGIWGLNIVYEANIGNSKEERETEFAVTGSMAGIVSNDWTLGGSTMYRHNFIDESNEYYIGPALQYRFNGKAYLSVEVMPGLTEASYASRSMVIFGWRF